ncbi:DUF1624 domain-containing protein [Aurantimonas litoralis]|nr:DUF1624 domain-containing protein [Aurantimonas litoralis]
MSATVKMVGSAVPEVPGSTFSPPRYVFVDVWRGLAIIGVVIYHFGWDLSFFGYVSPSLMFSIPVTVFARSLAGSFMFLVGVGLVLAHFRYTHWQKFLTRLAKIVVAAAAISVVTYGAFPTSFIYFGILHSIALGSLLGLLFLRLPIGLVFFASFATLAAPLFLETPTFNTRFLAWIGFAAAPPFSNDFVPVFPWFGVTLAGIGCTRLLVARPSKRDRKLHSPAVHLGRVLTWVGQRTLPIYLFHQPLLFAGFVVFTRLLAE